MQQGVALVAVDEGNALVRQCVGCKHADWKHMDCYVVGNPEAAWAEGDCPRYDDSQPDLQKVSEIAKRSVDRAALSSVEAIRKRNKQVDPWEDDGFWGWWAKTHPPDRRQREVLPPGEPLFKGGSKSGRKRKKPRKISDLRPWIIG